VIDSLNHGVVCVHDLEEALDFYCNVLGATLNSRVNFQIEEVLSGLAIFQSVILEDYLIAIAVAGDHMPAPPEKQNRGAWGFRQGFTVLRRNFDNAQKALCDRGIPFDGPVVHPAQGPFGESIYFKDPSGNFLELLWRRDEEANPTKRRFISAE
jgi:catechol-2,3-dioxygenase